MQLARKLREERSVDLSSGRLREILKKNYRWKRTRQSHRKLQDPVKRATKRADLEMLKLVAAEGEINLKYLDESGFCLRSPVSYSYSPRGEQKKIINDKYFLGFGYYAPISDFLLLNPISINLADK